MDRGAFRARFILEGRRVVCSTLSRPLLSGRPTSSRPLLCCYRKPVGSGLDEQVLLLQLTGLTILLSVIPLALIMVDPAFLSSVFQSLRVRPQDSLCPKWMNLWRFSEQPFVNLCHLLSTFWHILSTFGNLWQPLATFPNIWQLLPTLGNFWHFWQRFAIFGNLVNIW